MAEIHGWIIAKRENIAIHFILSIFFRCEIESIVYSAYDPK